MDPLVAALKAAAAQKILRAEKARWTSAFGN